MVTPGFSTNDIHQKMSLRASVTSELILDGVRLPSEAVLPNVTGLKGPLSCLNEARFGIMFGAVGAGRASYEAALAYAKDRVQFSKSIASYQLTQRKLVEMMVKVNQGMLLSLHLGRKHDDGTLTSEQISFGQCRIDDVVTALHLSRWLVILNTERDFLSLADKLDLLLAGDRVNGTTRNQGDDEQYG